MACPKCGCKETYEYVEDDILGLPDDQERCSACGHIFYFEDHAEEDDYEDLEELYEERAAIMHFDGGLPKEKAEALARAEMESHWNAIKKQRESDA